MLLLYRQLQELEDKLVEEEVERMVKEQIAERVKEIMNSESVQESLHARLVEERKILEEQVQNCFTNIHQVCVILLSYFYSEVDEILEE